MCSGERPSLHDCWHLAEWWHRQRNCRIGTGSPPQWQTARNDRQDVRLDCIQPGPQPGRRGWQARFRSFRRTRAQWRRPPSPLHLWTLASRATSHQIHGALESSPSRPPSCPSRAPPSTCCTLRSSLPASLPSRALAHHRMWCRLLSQLSPDFWEPSTSPPPRLAPLLFSLISITHFQREPDIDHRLGTQSEPHHVQAAVGLLLLNSTAALGGPNTARWRHLPCERASSVLSEPQGASRGNLFISSHLPDRAGISNMASIANSFTEALFFEVESTRQAHHHIIAPSETSCGVPTGCLPICQHERLSCTQRKPSAR